MTEMIVTYKGQAFRVRSESEMYALVLALQALERLAAVTGCQGLPGHLTSPTEDEDVRDRTG
jgi:hypothetical protein